METENGLDRRNNYHGHQGQEHGRVHQVQEREQHDRERLNHSQEQTLIAGQKADWQGESQKPHAPHEKTTTVFIDNKPYYIKVPFITGEEVRKLPEPAIGAEKDIFHVVAGNVGNVKMSDIDVIEISTRDGNHGRHFISSTRQVDELEKNAYFAYLNRGSQHGHDVEDWLNAEAQLKS